MKDTRPPVLMIGLDGFDPELGGRFLREGRMPRLASLLERGARFALDHGTEKYSGLAWEHVSLGQGPALTGRWSAVDFDPLTYAVTQMPTRHPPFAAELGARVVVFDAPYFDLARAPSVRGLVHWGAHDPGVAPRSNPSSLGEEVRERFGEYCAEPHIYGFSWPDPELTRAAGQALTAAVQQRAEAAHWLLAQRCPDWDLALVVVSEFHSAAEPFWHGVDAQHPLASLASAVPARAALEAIHTAADALIGRLADAFPEATLVVFAMHGMGRNGADVPAMLLLPELLHRDCFGTALFRPPAAWCTEGSPVLPPGARWEKVMRAHFAHPPPPGRWARFRAALTGRPLLVGQAPRGGAEQRVGQSLNWMPATQYARYWPQMEAFALPSFYDGRVRVNLSGREARGRVRREDYREVIARLRGLLEGCLDPATGLPAVAAIELPHSGDPWQLTPSEADLRIVWRGSPLALLHPRHGILGPVPWRRTGGHTGGHGMALFAGHGVRPGDYGLRSAFDVVPTVLDLLGERAARPLSGTSLIDTRFFAAHTALAGAQVRV